MKFLFLIVPISLLFFSLDSYARQETANNPENSIVEKSGEFQQESSEQTSENKSTTRDHRSTADYFIMGYYSPIDLLIPSKYGLSAGLITDADRTTELEYLRGSISVPFVVEDLGSMKDERFSIVRRHYFGRNSFNFGYGITYFDFTIHLGNKFLDQIQQAYPSTDLVEAQSLGFNLSIGNRWTFFRNITIGVDWISWAQPIFVTNKKAAFLDTSASEQDRKDVDKALDVITYFPRFSFFKLQLGILF